MVQKEIFQIAGKKKQEFSVCICEVLSRAASTALLTGILVIFMLCLETQKMRCMVIVAVITLSMPGALPVTVAGSAKAEPAQTVSNRMHRPNNLFSLLIAAFPYMCTVSMRDKPWLSQKKPGISFRGMDF